MAFPSDPLSPKKEPAMKSYTLAILLALLLFLGAACATAPVSTPEQKLKDIRRLLVLTGAAKTGMQVLQQMIGMQRRANPTVPPQFWTEFMKEVSGNEMVELIVPIYERNLTHDDIRGLIEFFQSPVGRNFVAAQSNITRESMAAGQRWGMSLGMRVLKKLRTKGYR